MKVLTISLISIIFSYSAHALESGVLINKAFRSEDAQMFKSMTVDTTKCKDGGAIIKFYGADAMSFCVGFEEVRKNVYKKCLGKEMPYPLGGCIGVKVKETHVSLKKVELDSEGNIVLNKSNSIDEKIVFEETYTLVQENENIRLNTGFQSPKDGRKGNAQYLFEK